MVLKGFIHILDICYSGDELCGTERMFFLAQHDFVAPSMSCSCMSKHKKLAGKISVGNMFNIQFGVPAL